MNTCNVDLFIHAVKYYSVYTWAREHAADLAYDRLLNKVKSHDTAMAEYHLDKDFMAFPATVSISIDAVQSNES